MSWIKRVLIAMCTLMLSGNMAYSMFILVNIENQDQDVAELEYIEDADFQGVPVHILHIRFHSEDLQKQFPGDVYVYLPIDALPRDDGYSPEPNKVYSGLWAMSGFESSIKKSDICQEPRFLPNAARSHMWGLMEWTPSNDVNNPRRGKEPYLMSMGWCDGTARYPFAKAHTAASR